MSCLVLGFVVGIVNFNELIYDQSAVAQSGDSVLFLAESNILESTHIQRLNDKITMKYQLCLCALLTTLAACDPRAPSEPDAIDSGDSTGASDSADTGDSPDAGDSADDSDSSDAGDSGDSGSADGDDSGSSDAGDSAGDSGSGADLDGNNQMLLLGLVKMEPNTDEADFSRALFGRLNTSLTADYIEDSFAPTADRCRVTQEDLSNNNSDPSLSVFDQATTLVSAGENVIVSSSGGTYATLDRKESAAGPHYQADVRQSQSTRTGLTVDVLGDEFPAFPTISIADVPALIMTNPIDGQSLQASTQLEWIPNNLNRSVIEMYSGGVGGSNNENLVVICTLVDDGSYVFPESIRAEMGGYVASWTSFLRISYSFEQNGDAIMAIANSVKSAQ